MKRLTVGMVVRDIRGLSVGNVHEIQQCCFAVKRDDRSILNLSADSVFNVEDSQVSLMCDRDESARYACPNHVLAR